MIKLMLAVVVLIPLHLWISRRYKAHCIESLFRQVHEFSGVESSQEFKVYELEITDCSKRPPKRFPGTTATISPKIAKWLVHNSWFCREWHNEDYQASVRTGAIGAVGLVRVHPDEDRKRQLKTILFRVYTLLVAVCLTGKYERLPTLTLTSTPASGQAAIMSFRSGQVVSLPADQDELTKLFLIELDKWYAETTKDNSSE